MAYLPPIVLIVLLFSVALAFRGHRTLDHPLKFVEIEHASKGMNHLQTFRSQEMPLHFGEVVFTDPKKTPLEMPSGKYLITSFFAGVVDDAGAQVPLSEVYNHHWLVFNGKGNLASCPGLDYLFGVGAESRGYPTSFPEPYGIMTDGTENWTANIHLLRTVNLDPAWGVQKCIECHGPNQWCSEQQTGTFACCDQGTFCPTTQNNSSTAANPKSYFLQYTVGWREISSSDKALGIVVLDASKCNIEYNVPETPSGLVPTELSWKTAGSGNLVMAVGHLHIGGVNTTFSINGKPVCTSYPEYGTEVGVAGHEAGYVTAIKPCYFDQPIPFLKGDNISVYSLYNTSPDDPRTPFSGAHECVMSLFYLGVHL